MIDLTARTFGRWTVLREVPHETGEKRRWRCRCACGLEADVRMDHLLDGTSASCGRRHEPISDLPLKTTGAAEALREHHDTYSPLGKVRRVAWPVDEDDQAGGVLHDFDAFNFDPVD